MKGGETGEDTMEWCGLCWLNYLGTTSHANAHTRRIYIYIFMFSCFFYYPFKQETRFSPRSSACHVLNVGSKRGEKY